jgi:hypothetical protein
VENIYKNLICLIVLVSGGWAQTDSLNIFWDANPELNLKEYRLYRSLNSVSDFQMIQVIPAPNIHTVDRQNIKPGNFYWYKMVAINTENEISNFSETAGVALPKINWTVSQIQTEQNTTLSLSDFLTDLDDNLSQLQITISNTLNIMVSLSGNELVLTPQPNDFEGTASFLLKVTDTDGFWDQKSIQINIVKEVTNIFSLHFPTIIFPNDQQKIIWLDTCVTVSPYTPSQISWAFSETENILLDYNPETRRVTFSSKGGWIGQESVTVYASNPNQEVKTIDLVITVQLSDDDLNEESIPLVFPNPYQPSMGHQFIIFDNLPSEASAISIYSPVGQKLFEYHFEPTLDHRWQWNVFENQASHLSSGFYIFMVKDKSGNKLKSGKFTVIR